MPLAVPVDLLNQGEDTCWSNLGEWSEARAYPRAAEDLAHRLGRAAGLAPGQRVLDVGCGAGDQLRVWIEAFGVAEVTGVERDPRMAERAAARVEGWGLTDRVRVRQGDAAEDPLPSVGVDAVLALDSAYFFRPRSAFIGNARRALRPGGVLALADLMLGTGTPACLCRLLAPGFGVPTSNLLTREAWMTSLREAGYGNVTIEDRTGAVLQGFARWVAGSDPAASHRRPSSGSMALTAFGRALGRLARSGGIGYAIITAEAPRA